MRLKQFFNTMKRRSKVEKINIADAKIANAIYTILNKQQQGERSIHDLYHALTERLNIENLSKSDFAEINTPALEKLKQQFWNAYKAEPTLENILKHYQAESRQKHVSTESLVFFIRIIWKQSVEIHQNR